MARINIKEIIMKKLCLTIALGLPIAAPLQAFASVNVFACEPEWASLSKEIGGDKVKVTTATSAFTDPHHIRARPSLIAAIRKSDLVFCSGSELEVGWLPILLEKAKASVQPTKTGYLMAANYVTALEVPKVLDRSHGDVHPGGNPHVHLNPHNILTIANELSNRLAQIDEYNSVYYQNNLTNFSIKWQESISGWEEKARALKNMPVVVHHKNWVYLNEWLSLDEVATLEPKPGIPPSASHLKNVLSLLKDKPAKAIIHAPYEDSKPSKWLSKKANITAIELPFTVGGNEQSQDLYSLFENIIDMLLKVNK